MMNDPLTWSPINLGRWGGIQIRVHISLIVFAVMSLLSAAVGKDVHFGEAACALLILLFVLLAHEAGHAAMSWWLGHDPDDVRLWPLGNLVIPTPSSRSNDNLMVALAGLMVSAAMVVFSLAALAGLGARFVWSPFGNPLDAGAPMLVAPMAKAAASSLVVGGNEWWKEVSAPSYSAAWFVGWFGYLNYVLLLVNLIPALPFDNGRVFRAYLANSSVTTSKDGLIAPLLARSCAIILLLAGLVRLLFKGRGDGVWLILLAVVIEWMVRAEARMAEDGGFYDDGVFGYDFSEGYTSLESSAAKVRPSRESALKRWRRRRSELRRQRSADREAAEERRMDEILAKLHAEGRTALTDEEHRFLLRASVKIRNKTKARD